MYLRLHNVVSVTVKADHYPASADRDEFQTTEYVFKDKDGREFSVCAFHNTGLREDHVMPKREG